MRTTSWMIFCACCVVWDHAVFARELTPRDIYEQASWAVVMVIGHSDSTKSGTGGTGSIIQPD